MFMMEAIVSAGENRRPAARVRSRASSEAQFHGPSCSFFTSPNAETGWCRALSLQRRQLLKTDPAGYRS